MLTKVLLKTYILLPITDCVAPPDGASLRDQLKPALERFFKVSNPANEYFVVMFNNKVRVVQDWTSDSQAVLQTLNSLTFKKYTSVWDAMTLALDKVKAGHNAKHILLVISDGPSRPKAKWRKVKIAAKQGTERLTARTRLWYYR